jgi:hypothetical protein
VERGKKEYFTKSATDRRNMSDSFDAETLKLLDETREVRIETRRDANSPEHRTIIWVVVVEDEVFVRSVRGSKGRWYRELSSNPEGALHVENNRIPVRAAPATDGPTVSAVSDAIRSKYEKTSPSSTASMVRPEILSTTLKLSPA